MGMDYMTVGATVVGGELGRAGGDYASSGKFGFFKEMEAGIASLIASVVVGYLASSSKFKKADDDKSYGGVFFDSPKGRKLKDDKGADVGALTGDALLKHYKARGDGKKADDTFLVNATMGVGADTIATAMLSAIGCYIFTKDIAQTLGTAGGVLVAGYGYSTTTNTKEKVTVSLSPEGMIS